eukprot:gene17347-biopygen12872
MSQALAQSRRACSVRYVSVASTILSIIRTASFTVAVHGVATKHGRGGGGPAVKHSCSIQSRVHDSSIGISVPSPVAHSSAHPREKLETCGAAGAAREKNEGIAAPQALPGATTCKPIT